MTKVSDLPPEEQAAHYAQIEDMFARIDEMDAMLAERAERRRLDGSEHEERHQEWLREREVRERQERAAAAPQQVPPQRQQRTETVNMTDAWAKWIRREINRKLDAFAGSLGSEMAKIDNEEHAKVLRIIEDRVTKSDTAVTELLMDMERRLAELEARLPPPRPKLVGGVDAA